jgi:hypothetical protein
MIIVAPVLLWRERPRVAGLLLGLCALSQFVGLAPIPGMSTWLDQQFTVISAATIAVFAAILWQFMRATAPVNVALQKGGEGHDRSGTPATTGR